MPHGGAVPVIDTATRLRLALRLRRLASGRSTNDDYEEEWLSRATDPGIRAIFTQGWTLYSDMRSYRLRGRDSLSLEARHAVARWVLFLQTDLEYEWPPAPAWDAVTLLAAGLSLGRVDLRDWGQWQDSGDVGVWPFFRQSDYRRACRWPRFLRGGDDAVV